MTGTLLTTLEVAERLGVSSAAVDQAVRAGVLQPTARTNEEFLFTERAVADFAAARAEASASPLQPPPTGTRAEWSGDVDRLNSWLKELTESLPSPPPGEASPASQALAPAAAAPIAALPVTGFPASPPTLPPADPVQRAQTGPATAETESNTPTAGPGLSLLERIAASPPLGRSTANPPAAEAVSPAPEHAPSAPPAEPEPTVQSLPGPILQPPPPAPAASQSLRESDGPARPEAPAAEPEHEPVAALEPPGAAPDSPREPLVAQEVASGQGPGVTQPVPVVGMDLSRQAVLVVQPVVRFRVLRDVADRLSEVPGIADARLVGLKEGVASYRLSFEAERPNGETIGEALASLNLEVILVDSFL